MKSLLYIAALAGLVLFVSASARAQALAYHDGDVLDGDTVWRGEVLVDGVLFVPENVTLTVMPGTVVRFTKSDAEFREGTVPEAVIPGSGLRVEGTVIADGTTGSPITFTSAEAGPGPGAWGCLFFNHSTKSRLSYCRFEYSTYTIHAHFSLLDLSHSVITKNVDGSRLGYSRISIDHCDITANTGKGLNFANCRNTVRYCNITDNNEGIFLNQRDSDCVIQENNIHDNSRFDLSLGEFHKDDVTLSGNWWGTTDTDDIADKVYDKSDDEEIGRAHITPSGYEIPNAGADGLDVDVVWKFKTGGYVDSSPAFSKGRVYFGSWDHNLYCLDEKTGELAWKFETGDCVDSSPAIYEGRVYFGSWNRSIYCLDAGTGDEVWRYEMEPSNFDDHRQASPAVFKTAGGTRPSVFVGGFNGKLYLLADGRAMSEFATGGPVRSRAALGRMTHPGEGSPAGETRAAAVGSGDGYLYVAHLGDTPGGDAYITGVERVVTGGAVFNSPALSGGLGYFGSEDGNIYCVDYESLDILWKFQTKGKIVYSCALLADNLVLIGSTDHRLYALDKNTGQALWSFDTGGVIYSSPQRSKKTVVIGNNEGMVWWLDAKTGSPKAVFRAGDAVQALSTGPGGVIYAGSRDGYLYCLSAGK